MDLTKEALQHIADQAQVQIIEVEGQKYSTKNLAHIKYPAPADLNITTLTGLIDYIKSNVDNLVLNYSIIHVKAYNKVEFISSILPDSNRHSYIVSEAQTPKITFEKFLPIENFNIMMQAAFIPDHTTDCILQIVGNIQEENVRNTGDDGVSQTVKDLESQGVLYDKFDNKADIDITAQTEWLKLTTVIDDWSETDIKQAATGSNLFVMAQVKIQDAVEDMKFSIYIN